MATIQKKNTKRTIGVKKTKKSGITKGLGKRKSAIEDAISFWKDHAVDLSDFKFNRTEANAR
jgi:hypothetical protein